MNPKETFRQSTAEKLSRLFPEGTPVILKEESKTGTGTFVTSEVVGTVVDWRYEPTGASYAECGNPNTSNAWGHVQLLRLRLRKVDGEISDFTIDYMTSIARMEAK